MMETKKVKIDRSSISKLFTRWQIKTYENKFISQLKRLDSLPDEEENFDIEPTENVTKFVDSNFMILLKNMKENCLPVDAPGIFMLWFYLEKLGILNVLETMGLTRNLKRNKGYVWLDFFLIDFVRRFYGIETHSGVCRHEEPTLSFFSHLITMPTNDTFLNGLAVITEEQTFLLRKWLTKRMYELGLVQGKNVAFNFHSIDKDVKLGKLRKFGKGHSAKKKICYNGFRPHIAWDINTGNLITAEFRKDSAPGTTTIKRFINDFIPEPFKNLFDTIYINSEYTGKDVWNFILNDNDGLGAELTACLKQNSFVKKARDEFLMANSNAENFWIYYDINHVYSSKTFNLKWIYKEKKTGNEKQIMLNCVVKKNINNNKFRVFGTSKLENNSTMILKDYSQRWQIENGIKDLIKSYYLDNCPGTVPHHVDVHFLMVSICRNIYRMIEEDIGDFIKNDDGTTKTLNTMRELLFRQGNGEIKLNGKTIEIKFKNRYSFEQTKNLKKWFEKVNQKKEGLELLGGLKIKFRFKYPNGEEFKNKLKKVPLFLTEKNK